MRIQRSLHLRQSGEYDATFEARLAPDGAYRVEGGSYVTRGVREGVLTRAEAARLAALVDAADLSAEHPIPDGAPGFTSELTVGERRLRWWGPPPTDALRALTGALAALGA
ncbi:MAG: hypothetical protein AAGI52_16665 [Bacteroidota bacterium]